MHGPDAETQSERAGADPDKPDAALGCGGAASEIERGVGSKDGDRDGEKDEKGRVGVRQGRGAGRGGGVIHDLRPHDERAKVTVRNDRRDRGVRSGR